jgi:nucleoside-diphosphate-sugar epimerase
MTPATRTSRTKLVSGASGTVGPSLIRYLLATGHRVRALVRSVPEDGILPTEVELVQGDITRPESLMSAVEGVDAIFHLAAKLHISDPSPELAAEYRRVNVDGTRNLARAAAEAGVGRFVHFSTINVYGTGNSETIFSEESSADPDSLYGQTKLESESVALAEHPAAAVLRLGAVYGSRMRGNYPLLLKALGKGMPFMIGDGQNRRTLVHVEDVARAAVAAATHPNAVGQTFNVTDGCIHTFDEIARAMQSAMGRKEGIHYLPAAPFKLALSVSKKAADTIRVRRFPSPALIDKLTEDMAVSGDKIQQDLGFTPAFDLRRGWIHAVELMAER